MRNLSVMVKIFVLMMCLGSIAGRVVSWDDALSLEEFGEAAGYGMEKLSSVLVTGAVVCDACLDENIATHPEPISGAVVGVACGAGNKRKAIRARGVADRYGDFLIDLPSDLHANPYLDRTCVVKVLKVPKKSLCKATFVRKHKAIKLSSFGNGIREYTAGNIRLHNLKHTAAQDCAKKSTKGKQM
ncbi:hypothetical protein QQ045_006132 [Rhodiola kirilowii]